MRRSVFAVGAVLLGVLSLMGFVADCEAGSRILSQANINLVDPPFGQYTNTSCEPNTATHAEAKHDGPFYSTFSQSDSNTDFKLAVSARSQNYWLGYPSSSSAFYESYFTILGNPNGYRLPLTFTFSIDAKISVRTGYRGIGIASVEYDFYNGKRGAFIYAEQYKVPAYLQRTGAFARGSSGTASLDIKPIITATFDVPVSKKDSIPITTEDLNYLRIALPSDINSVEDLRIIADLIILRIFEFGLPRIALAPRVKVDVGFDLSWRFNVKPKVEEVYESKGLILLVILSSGQTTVDASSESSFTMSLKSVALPADYTEVDPSNLSIMFDSGLTMNVTREEPPPPINP